MHKQQSLRKTFKHHSVAPNRSQKTSFWDQPRNNKRKPRGERGTNNQKNDSRRQRERDGDPKNDRCGHCLGSRRRRRCQHRRNPRTRRSFSGGDPPRHCAPSLRGRRIPSEEEANRGEARGRRGERSAERATRKVGYAGTWGIWCALAKEGVTDPFTHCPHRLSLARTRWEQVGRN